MALRGRLPPASGGFFGTFWAFLDFLGCQKHEKTWPRNPFHDQDHLKSIRMVEFSAQNSKGKPHVDRFKCKKTGF